MKQRDAPIPEGKINRIKELTDLIKNKKTILIASIKNIPASQFQEIGKKLRGKAIIKVPKKSLIFRTLDSSGKDEIKKIKEHIQDNVAILFSDIDCFELASELMESKSPAKAKVGQEAPEDIEIQAGPTDLIPGPAISELGALGIQIQIDKGKINIKEPKVIVKKGEKISENAAGIMSKLDIKPFSIGFVPLSAFDSQEEKLYLNIKIDKAKTIEELKTAFGKALPFAVEIGYISKDTIGFMISKAGAEANKINRIMTGEPEPMQATELPTSSASTQSVERKEEEKAPAAAGLGALFG
jgi:large subunit ribosomal protein L10